MSERSDIDSGICDRSMSERSDIDPGIGDHPVPNEVTSEGTIVNRDDLSFDVMLLG